MFIADLASYALFPFKMPRSESKTSLVLVSLLLSLWLSGGCTRLCLSSYVLVAFSVWIPWASVYRSGKRTTFPSAICVVVYPRTLSTKVDETVLRAFFRLLSPRTLWKLCESSKRRSFSGSCVSLGEWLKNS